MRIELSTWPAVEDYFQRGNDLVVMAIGSTEEHGRHNPLGTDTLAPNLLLDKIEAALGKDVLIAPTIPFGNADDLLGFPGTLSIGYDLLRSLVRTLSMQLYDYGARRFLLINGHGPNIKPISSVCEELNRRGCLAARADWWLMAGELNPAWRGGHGGAEETAAVFDHLTAAAVYRIGAAVKESSQAVTLTISDDTENASSYGLHPAG